MSKDSQKEIRKILKRCKKHGILISVGSKGHYKLTFPNGNYVACSFSPSDRMAHKNVIKDIKKYGGIDITL